jgi:hypothetical protein
MFVQLWTCICCSKFFPVMRSSDVRPVQDTCKQLLHPSQFIEGKPPIGLSQLAQALILTFAAGELPKKSTDRNNQITLPCLSILNPNHVGKKERKTTLRQTDISKRPLHHPGARINFISLLQGQKFFATINHLKSLI